MRTSAPSTAKESIPPGSTEIDLQLTVNRDRSRRNRSVRSVGLCTVLIVLGAVLAACSSDTPAPSPSSSPAPSSASASSSSSVASSAAKASVSTSGASDKEAACAARTQLQTSVDTLTSSSLLTSGTTAIKAAVDQVQTDLNSLAAAAKDDYRPQIDAVQSDLKQLQTSVSALGSGNVSENLTALGSSIAATGTSAQALLKQVQADCGS